MRVARSYVLELCWLVILLVLMSLTPAAGEGYNFEDVEGGCDSVSGWCVDILAL
jgi:hypothetical protein